MFLALAEKIKNKSLVLCVDWLIRTSNCTLHSNAYNPRKYAAVPIKLRCKTQKEAGLKTLAVTATKRSVSLPLESETDPKTIAFKATKRGVKIPRNHTGRLYLELTEESRQIFRLRIDAANSGGGLAWRKEVRNGRVVLEGQFDKRGDVEISRVLVAWSALGLENWEDTEGEVFARPKNSPVSVLEQAEDGAVQLVLSPVALKTESTNSAPAG